MHERSADDPVLPSTAGRPWWAANELLALLLELVALGCLFGWGFSLADNLAVRSLLGCAVLAAAIVLWALFAAPRARFRPPLAGVLAVKALVLGGGAFALYGVGHPTAAAVMGAVVVVNTALAETFRRRPAPAA
ncbi:YrdB family protein [Streptomyces sp. NPDC086838]|uniref:YrdB family protein n=1 Tax=Streptomyces sp. NPDC086838 TaxID=3365762 RepID=UPI00380EF56B